MSKIISDKRKKDNHKLIFKNHGSTSDYSINTSRRSAKKFKWTYRCPGCGKQFREPVKICHVYETDTKLSRTHKK